MIEKPTVIQVPMRQDIHPDEVLLRCGEIVPKSGIYEALHGAAHGNEAAPVIAVRGEMVQPCSYCGQELRLRLIYMAPHISEDSDFR
jgi:hypothetical protein